MLLTPRAYYNEIDPFAAQWLRNLIDAGQIAAGDVDTRSVVDVTPLDLAGYTQCHFFAGIGVWSYALRLAGQPDTRRVWTGSCPCQPFSQAGKGAGVEDIRHLWPSWFHLIEFCKPEVILGEQVASPAGLGWLDLVHADLEGADYACGAVDLCAAGIGAPHIRQRLYFVAHNNNNNSRRLEHAQRDSTEVAGREEGARGNDTGRRGELCEMGDSSEHGSWRDTGAVPSTQTEGDLEWLATGSESHIAQSASTVDGLGNNNNAGLEGRRMSGSQCCGERSPWSPSDLVWCRDGKWRPVEPGTFPLAHGVVGRVGRLRAYGNAIVAPLAAEFIKAAL